MSLDCVATWKEVLPRIDDRNPTTARTPFILSKPFVVIAEFMVKPDSIAAFLDAARKDAEQSLAHEPGCRQFDIIHVRGAEGAVVFYEVYDSPAAFDDHLRTSHVAEFRTAFPPLIITEKPVRFADQCYP